MFRLMISDTPPPHCFGTVCVYGGAASSSVWWKKLNSPHDIWKAEKEATYTEPQHLLKGIPSAVLLSLKGSLTLKRRRLIWLIAAGELRLAGGS